MDKLQQMIDALNEAFDPINKNIEVNLNILEDFLEEKHTKINDLKIQYTMEEDTDKS